jgi:hypothetical protein
LVLPAAGLTWYAITHIETCGAQDWGAVTALIAGAVLAVGSMALPRSIHIPWSPWRDGPIALVAIVAIAMQVFGAVAVAFGGCDGA